MQYKKLGQTDLNVSVIAMGGAPIGLTNYLGQWDPSQPAAEEQISAAIHRAVELGINYIDTAFNYGAGTSERIIGKALQTLPAGQPHPFLATKAGGPFRHDHILASAEKSLVNLGVETLDVLQLHGNYWNDEEVSQVFNEGGLEALQELKRQGKVRFIGLTSEGGSPGAHALVRSGQFDVLQIAYNILYQDACNLAFQPGSGIIIEAKERNMGVVTMRSLTSGIFQKLMKQQQPDIEQHLDLNALSLNYVLSNPYVDSAIVGMRLIAEVEKNVRIANQTENRLDLIELHKRYV
jgi:aryl-alcohol dehydrogenase-like predicted oxidoreductase